VKGVLAAGTPGVSEPSSPDPIAALAQEWLALYEDARVARQRARKLRSDRNRRGVRGSPDAGSHQSIWQEAHRLNSLLYELAERIEATPAMTLRGAVLRVEVGLKGALFEEHFEEEDYQPLLSAIVDLKRLVDGPMKST